MDSFSYRLSNARADELVGSGQGRRITLPDGRAAIQLYRPRAAREQWVEYFEAVVTSGGSSLGCGPVKWVPPKHESWLKTKLHSNIPNVRSVRIN